MAGEDAREPPIDPAANERAAERLERERRTRLEAERIAEDATRRLFTLTEELERSNAELERLNATLRDFVAIASHELQTPVTPIIGFAVTLRERWGQISDEDKLQYLTVIERQARRLERLTGLLLTVSSLNADSLRARPTVIDVARAIGTVVDGFEGEEAEIRSSCPRGLVAFADANLTDQILSNFVTNALRYGRPPIEVDAREAGRWVELRVLDHGDGVPAAFVGRLFERFSQADVRMGSGGTGLGLYIVRGLARAQSGDAWYSRADSGGACFTVKLPRPETKEREPHAGRSADRR